MAHQIAMPARLRSVLARDLALLAGVDLTLRDFSLWIGSSGMPFFPGFTDHSPTHITEVLISASSLISDESFELISPSDAAVLTLAAMLHDCGMHLLEDGFRDLVSGRFEDGLVADLGDKSWKLLWNEFLQEASRFDGRTLERIFGDSTPLDLRSVNPDNLSERDKLLVGEFLRRNHAALAHQIALVGVPGTDSRLKLKEIDSDIADMSGLVARSHNLHLRSTYAYLDSRYARVEYRGVHAPFLMVVLRIADYIQIHAERAPGQLLAVKRLRSPLSRLEWKTHHTVRDIRNTDEDPEALFVDALPATAQLFEKLRALLRDIQSELDVCTRRGLWSATTLEGVGASNSENSIVLR